MIKNITAYKDLSVDFNEEKHQLFVKGEKNPWNVTGITKVIDKSPQLIWWAVGITKAYLLEMVSLGKTITAEDIVAAGNKHREEKEKAATIGDIIHEFAEQFSLGLKPEIPTDEKAKNGVLAFLRWIDQEKIEIKNPEEIVLSKKYGFWGIKDSDGFKGVKGSIRKNRYVIDYKTSKAIYPEMRLQASAYLFASQEMNKVKYAGYWIVKFGKEDGAFETLYVSLKEAKKDFKAFLAAFELKKRLTEIK